MKLFHNTRKVWRYARGYGAGRRVAIELVIRELFTRRRVIAVDFETSGVYSGFNWSQWADDQRNGVRRTYGGTVITGDFPKIEERAAAEWCNFEAKTWTVPEVASPEVEANRARFSAQLKEIVANSGHRCDALKRGTRIHEEMERYCHNDAADSLALLVSVLKTQADAEAREKRRQIRQIECLFLFALSALLLWAILEFNS